VTCSSIAVALCAVVALAGPLRAQKAAHRPFPPLTVDPPELRIEAHTLGLQLRQGVIGVGPAGQIVVAPQYGEMVGFDSTGKPSGLKVPTGWQRDLEIRLVNRIGWLTGAHWGANTMWVADPGYQQVMLLDKNGALTKSLEAPSWVRPSLADRRKFPIFARVDPLALYPDGSWLVVPSRERSLLATPEYDKKFSYLMRIEEGGKMRQTLARVPRNEILLEIKSGRETRTLPIPYYPRTYWDAINDGTRIAVVTPHFAGRDSATFRVTVIDERGDTVFAKGYPFTPQPIPAAAVDSVRQRTRMRVGTMTAEEVGKLLTDRMPPFYPPVLGIHVGRDRTIWVELKPASPDAREWLVLDRKGEVIGVATLPKGVALLEADRAHVWGFERSAQVINAVVRMRVR